MGPGEVEDEDKDDEEDEAGDECCAEGVGLMRGR